MFKGQVSDGDIKKVTAYLKSGTSQRQTSAKTGVSITSVNRIYKASQAVPPAVVIEFAADHLHKLRGIIAYAATAGSIADISDTVKSAEELERWLKYYGITDD